MVGGTAGNEKRQVVGIIWSFDVAHTHELCLHKRGDPQGTHGADAGIDGVDEEEEEVRGRERLRNSRRAWSTRRSVSALLQSHSAAACVMLEAKS